MKRSKLQNTSIAIMSLGVATVVYGMGLTIVDSKQNPPYQGEIQFYDPETKEEVSTIPVHFNKKTYYERGTISKTQQTFDVRCNKEDQQAIGENCVVGSKEITDQIDSKLFSNSNSIYNYYLQKDLNNFDLYLELGLAITCVGGALLIPEFAQMVYKDFQDRKGKTKELK